MGGTGIRAVALCDDHLVNTLNENFVCVYADEFEKNDGPWTRLGRTEESATLLQRIRQIYSSIPGTLIKVFIILPDGTIKMTPNLMTNNPLLSMTAQLVPYVKAHSTTMPLPERFRSHPSREPGENGVALRVVARYDRAVTKQRLERMNAQQSQTMTGFVYMPAFVAPLRDWLILSQGTLDALLPRGNPIVGTTQEVDSETAAAILSHFCPESAPIYVSENPVELAELSTQVWSVKSSTVRLYVWGHARLGNRGLSGRADDRQPLTHLELSVTGYLDYDRSSGKVLEMQLATDHAVDRANDGSSETYRAVAYLVR